MTRRTDAAFDSKNPRAALEAKLRDIAQLTPDPEDLKIESLPDPLDQVRSISDRDIAVQRLDTQSRMKRDIEVALAKLPRGKYGLCEGCDDAISPKRLQALPWARLCVACQAKAEAEERNVHGLLAEAA